MCGRFVQLKRRRDYERYLRAVASRDTKPEEERSRWNIPPSTPAWVVREIAGTLRVDRLIWGRPAAADGGSRLVNNARVESAAEKSLFRDAWKARRCVVPVEGWYEWQSLGGGRRQPYYFTLGSGDPILLAGLWTDTTFVLLTAATHGALATVHSRRPVALGADEARAWCRPATGLGQADAVLRAMTVEEAFAVIPVSDAVNGTRQDGPELIRAINPASVLRPDLLLPGF